MRADTTAMDFDYTLSVHSFLATIWPAAAAFRANQHRSYAFLSAAQLL